MSRNQHPHLRVVGGFDQALEHRVTPAPDLPIGVRFIQGDELARAMRDEGAAYAEAHQPTEEAYQRTIFSDIRDGLKLLAIGAGSALVIGLALRDLLA